MQNYDDYEVFFEKPKKDIDVQPLMNQVYMWMAGGLLVTALVAFFTVSTSLVYSVINPMIFYGVFFGELALVWWLSANLHKMKVETAAIMFFVYAVLNGFTLSVIFLIYDIGSIAPAFMTTAGLFGAMSIIAITTNVDLSKYGSFLMMGVLGLFIAIIVNMFVGSSGLDWLISIAGVVIFTALTAYDTQRIYQMAREMPYSETPKLAIMGALRLYLDFINLFLFILRLFGGSRR